MPFKSRRVIDVGSRLDNASRELLLQRYTLDFGGSEYRRDVPIFDLEHRGCDMCIADELVLSSERELQRLFQNKLGFRC